METSNNAGGGRPDATCTPSLTPETDALVRETLSSPTVTDTILSAKLTLKCQELERERDEWRNEHDRVVREYQHRLTVLATSAIEATNYPENAEVRHGAKNADLD